MRRIQRSKRGLSEIVGTLMLVVIVVSAATILAAFVATYQKQLQTEETFTHDQSLESIHILGLTTQVSDGAYTSFGFTLASEYVNPSIVQGITIDGAAIRDFTWYNITTSMGGAYWLGGNLNLTSFDLVNVTLCLFASCPIPGSATPSTTATTFSAPTDSGSPWTGTGDAYFVVPSGFVWKSYDSIALAATTDITDSGPPCAGTTTAGSITAAATGETVSTTYPYTLTVPFTYSFDDAACGITRPTGVGLAATGDAMLSRGVPFSFLSANEVPLPNQYLKFDIYTVLQNDFTRVYLPPTPLAVVSEINPSGNNPITLLDGSTSFQPGGNASIVDWSWSITGVVLNSTGTTISSPGSGDVAGSITGTGTATFAVPAGFGYLAGDSVAFAPGQPTTSVGTSCALSGMTLTPTSESVAGTTLSVDFNYGGTASGIGCGSAVETLLTAGGVNLIPTSSQITVVASGEEVEVSPALPALMPLQAPYSVTLAVTNSDGLTGTITISYTPPT